MKRFLVGLMVILFLAPFAYAYPTATGEVSDTPYPGLFKTLLSSNQSKGAVCQIGGNTFVKVLNDSGVPCFQGEPAFWRLSDADGYSVTTYESSSFYDTFAGTWYCSNYGGTTVAIDGTGWIQVKGVGNMLVSGEGSAVAVGDVLSGIITAVTSTDTTARAFAMRDHAIRTSSTGTGSFELDVIRYPKALQTKADGSVGMIKVFLGM